MIRKARTVKDAKAEPTPQGGSIAVDHAGGRDLGHTNKPNQDVILTHLRHEYYIERQRAISETIPLNLY